MTFSRFAKAIVLAVLAAILLTVSAVFLVRLHTPALMEKTYFETNLYWFVAAVALLGTGIYVWRDYARKDRDHLPDALLLVGMGVLLVIGWFVMFLLFGGLLEGRFNEAAYTAVNINTIVLWALPIPLLIRLAVLAFGTGIDETAKRRAMQIVAGLLVVAVIVTTAVGGTLRMMRYVEPIENPTLDMMEE